MMGKYVKWSNRKDLSIGDHILITWSDRSNKVSIHQGVIKSIDEKEESIYIGYWLDNGLTTGFGYVNLFKDAKPYPHKIYKMGTVKIGRVK